MLKRRSLKACRLCRSRKVKCDVDKTGIPCSKCAKASNPCSVQPARKGRLTLQPSKHGLRSANIHVFEVDTSTGDGITVDKFGESAANFSASQAYPLQVSSEVISFGAGQTTRSPDTSDRPMDALHILPEYVAPLPSELGQDVLQFLHRNGALTLPDQLMMEEILRMYVCYVHPLLPLLDLGHLLKAIHGDTKCTISLVLLQAIVFASSAVLDLEQIRTMGFVSHSDAKNSPFSRVKLLYEMDVERDPLTVIQVLLLMTYCGRQQSGTKGSFYWMRIAISLAMDIGLHRLSEQSSTTSRASLTRRVWYCCVIREKLLSLTERRAGSHSDYTLHRLNPKLEDFNEVAFVEALSLYYLPHCEVEATALTKLCMQKTKLCSIIGRILDSQYELMGLRHAQSESVYMVLAPKRTSTAMSDAVIRDLELQDWRSETVAIEGSCFDGDHRRNGRVLGVHSATIEMLYYAAVFAVHRPQIIQDFLSDSATGSLQRYPQQMLKLAARRITKIGSNLQDGHLVQFLPRSVVGAFILSSTQHLEDSLQADTELRSVGQTHLDQTLATLALLRGKYDTADRALRFFDSVRSGGRPLYHFEWENGAGTDLCFDNDLTNLRTNASNDYNDVNLGFISKIGHISELLLCSHAMSDEME